MLCLASCASEPSLVPDSCAGFRVIRPIDPVVRGDAIWRSVPHGSLIEAGRDILTPETARAIVAHNRAYGRFCAPAPADAR